MDAKRMEVKSHPIERGIVFFEKALTGLSFVAFVAMLFIIFIGTLTRYFFNYPLAFVEEYSGYLLLVSGFLGMAYALRVERHVSVDAVKKILSLKVNFLLEIGAYIVSIIVASILLWVGVSLCYEDFSSHRLSSTIMETPLWIPQLFIPLGWLAFILLCLLRLWKHISNSKRLP